MRLGVQDVAAAAEASTRTQVVLEELHLLDALDALDDLEELGDLGRRDVGVERPAGARRTTGDRVDVAVDDVQHPLADERDRFGLRIAKFSHSMCDNDHALVDAAQKVMEDILHAAGATDVMTIQRFAHLVGGARMSVDEAHGVVDRHGRTFAVPNLHIVDGSTLPTQGSANPALTIMALAARAAAHMDKRAATHRRPARQERIPT